MSQKNATPGPTAPSLGQPNQSGASVRFHTSSLQAPGAGCTCSPQRKKSGLYLQPAKEKVRAVLAARKDKSPAVLAARFFNNDLVPVFLSAFRSGRALARCFWS